MVGAVDLPCGSEVGRRGSAPPKGVRAPAGAKRYTGAVPRDRQPDLQSAQGTEERGPTPNRQGTDA